MKHKKHKKYKVSKAAKKVLLFAVIAVLLPFKPGEYKAITEDDVKKAEQELQAAKDREAEIEQQLSDLSVDISSTKDYISEVDRMISDVTARIYELDLLIEEKQAEIDAKQIEIDTTQAGIAAIRAAIDQTEIELSDAYEAEAQQYASMKLRIQYMYENGEDTFMDILFSSDSMVDFLNNAEYISEISKYDREKLIEYGATKDRIATLLANLQGQEQELLIQEARYEEELAQLNAQKAELDSKRAEREVEQNSYNAIYEAKNNELNNLQAEQSNTEELRRFAELEVEEQEARAEQARREYAAWLAELARRNQDAEAAVAAKLAEINVTGFTWPIPGYNRITSQYGMRMHPILGYEKLHDGTDISGADINGKPIVAAYGGTVVLSEYYWGYGECVKIDHGGGIQTLYAHASVRLVSVGQQVNAGDTIALVGSTGNSTGPHLHFSLIIKGEFVNPLEYVVVPR